MAGRDGSVDGHAHRDLGGIALRDRVHGAEVVVHEPTIGDPHLAVAGRSSTTCGRIVPKYGTRTLIASENSRPPPIGSRLAVFQVFSTRLIATGP